MKKQFFYPLVSLLTAICLIQSSGFAGVKRTEAKGEIVSVDSVYSSVTIKHGAIKDFSGDGETAFTADPSLLKNINKRDLVDFVITDDKGDVRLATIMKTGVAEPEVTPKIGQVVQDVLVGTGEVAKGITSPIAPAHQLVSGAVDATTDTTGALLNDADTQVKKKF